MTKIRKSLLQLIFSGSSMRRWNDKLRPVELYEIDKQAHKMLTTFFLYRLQCRRLNHDEALKLGQELIEGCLFDYFYRLIITDIKPPIFYRICENKEHFEELTAWVLKELEPVIRPAGEEFWTKLVNYHQNKYNEEESLADRILNVAHLYASKWEFNLIRNLNYFDEELRDIDASFTEQLQAMRDIDGVNELLASASNPLVRVINLCGQLRFQIRWSQSSRIPETSVLGHMFVVATCSYLLSLDLGLCSSRAINNFFAGLMHDLPELLTRDIINPVKNSVDYIPKLIHQYERNELERRILVPLQLAGYDDIVSRISYYLGIEEQSEYQETILDVDGNIHIIKSFDELDNKFNLNQFDGKDGQLIKACDTLAAFLEVHNSIYHGVSSGYLHEAISRIRKQCQDIQLGHINFKTLLADFD